MIIDQSIFKAYDIRGIYPTQINEEIYPDIIKAIYTFYLKALKKERLTIVLGRDMRTSGPVLFEIAKTELVKLGATVIDIGLASTPTFYYACANYGYDAGIHVTAPHNPKEYTGIKFAIRNNTTLIKVGKNYGMEEIRQNVLSKTFAPYLDGGKIIPVSTILHDEIESAINAICPNGVKRLKIVADPANAMGCIFLKALFERVPADFIMINDTLDGTFPIHEPSPIEYKNLKDLVKKVKEEKADLGIAPDGDGDRVFFIDENGKVVKATAVSSIIAYSILTNSPGSKIIADIRDVRNIKEVCKKYGGKFVMSIVGHAFISELLNKEKAPFAGESSGHFFFKETGGAENSIRAILHILKAVSDANKPLSEVVEQYMTSAEHEEVNFIIAPPADVAKILAQIEQNYSDGAVDKSDRLSVEYPDWRFNLRTSNTENDPIMRVNVEGATEDLVNNKFAELKSIIEKMGGRLKE